MSDTSVSGTPARVLALGSINADFQVRVAHRPDAGETLIAGNFLRLGGGKAANVAFLAARLNVPAQLFAHAGDDDLAEQALAPLRGMEVDLSGVRRVPGMATGCAMIMVPPDGKKSIVMSPNANDAWQAGDERAVVAALRAAPPGSVLAADCEVPVFAVEAAMHAARDRNVITVLDPSPPGRVDDALLRLADVVIPDAREARSLTGIDGADAATAFRIASRLRQRGARAACVKLEDGGCVLLDHAHRLHIPPVPVPVVDATGAGDAFAGALAATLALRHPLPEAVRFAVAASHLAVTAYGSQPAYPERGDIERMAQRLDVRSDAGR